MTDLAFDKFGKPEFNNPEKYLKSGEMTKAGADINNAIIEIYNNLKSSENSDIDKVKQILLYINKNVPRQARPDDDRKFKRTAEEILHSKVRTGCCDSSTLYSAIAKRMNIPTMQVITLNTEWCLEKEKIEEKTGRKISDTRGHYFVASYLREKDKEGKWVIIDSDQPVHNIDDINLEKFNKNIFNRNITRRYYAFSYVNDYRDVNVDGIQIDSKRNMALIQQKAWEIYKELNKNKEDDIDR